MKRHDPEMVYEGTRHQAPETQECRGRPGREGDSQAPAFSTSFPYLPPSARVRRRRGIAMAWTAVVLLTLVGIVGLGIDCGKLAFNTHELQNAGDAAALAGAQFVRTDRAKAIDRAHTLAFANHAEKLAVTLRTTAQPSPWIALADPQEEQAQQDSWDILVGRWVTLDHQFIPTYDGANAVRVVARRQDGLGAEMPPVAYVFGQAFGTSTADVRRRAIAWNPYSSGGEGLICLSDPTTPGLQVGGNAVVDVRNGGIHVNSIAEGKNQKAGDWVQNGAKINCGQLNVQGGSTPAGGTLDGSQEMSTDWERIFLDEEHSFSVVEEAGRLDDPLKAIMGTDNLQTLRSRQGLPPLPPLNAAGITATITASADLAPGYYPGGIRLTTPGTTINLVPSGTDSIFVFGGGSSGVQCGLYVDGGNLIGHGVTCYVTKSYGYGEKWGVTRLAGNGTIDLTSPADQQGLSGEGASGLIGIALWQDPQNPNEVHLNGGGRLAIEGTLYFPDPGRLVLEGNLEQAGNQILTGSAQVLGRALVTVNCDGRNNYGATHRSFLVK